MKKLNVKFEIGRVVLQKRANVGFCGGNIARMNRECDFGLGVERLVSDFGRQVVEDLLEGHPPIRIRRCRDERPQSGRIKPMRGFLVQHVDDFIESLDGAENLRH